MKALCINPPVYDFAAYDFWMKPLGFLTLIDLLKKNNFEIFFFDFMDRNHPFYENFRKKEKYGCGNFYYQIVEKPGIYKDVPRRYKRYGLPLDIFENFLDSISPPDFIFITSGMTYWCIGVEEVVKIVKRKFPSVPVILGGIYASLCPSHAQKTGADMIFEGKDLRKFVKVFSEKFSVVLNFLEKIQPCWDVYEKLSYLCVKTSSGCPFSCYYCAIKKLEPGITQFPEEEIVEHIIKNSEKFHVRDIAFYDDALLLNFEKHLLPILKNITAHIKNLRFHTPNGVHPRYITEEVAYILKEMNFKTIRLSLETISPEREKESGYKVSFQEFENSIKFLIDAGFTEEEIGVYILAGLPGQSYEEVMETVRILKNYPCKIKIAEYSPIPGTVDFEISKKLYPELPLDNPLFQNNTIFPLWNFPDKWEKINKLKEYKNL